MPIRFLRRQFHCAQTKIQSAQPVAAFSNGGAAFCRDWQSDNFAAGSADFSPCPYKAPFHSHSASNKRPDAWAQCGKNLRPACHQAGADRNEKKLRHAAHGLIEIKIKRQPNLASWLKKTTSGIFVGECWFQDESQPGSL
jgi:hypothetical protein